MPEWLTPILSAGFALAGGYLGVRINLARLEMRVRYLESEVGMDSNSGLRGARHKHRGQIGNLAGHIDELRERAALRPLDLADAFRKDEE